MTPDAPKPESDSGSADEYDQTLENHLSFALYAASRAITKTYRDRLLSLGLTYPQYLVLTVLWEQDARTLTDIGRRLRLDSGTLTPLVKRLEAGGLVTRCRRSSDEREIEISLTPTGQSLRSAAAEVRRDVGRSLDMPEDAKGRLRAELMALVNALDDESPQQAN